MGPVWWPDPRGSCLDFFSSGVDQPGDQFKPGGQGYVGNCDVRLWQIFDFHADFCARCDFE